MKFNIKDYKKKHFKVKLYNGHGSYFIVSTFHRSCAYLHRDGTVRDFCGEPNFYDTKAEAHALLNRIFLKDDILYEELFEI